MVKTQNKSTQNSDIMECLPDRDLSIELSRRLSTKRMFPISPNSTISQITFLTKDVNTVVAQIAVPTVQKVKLMISQIQESSYLKTIKTRRRILQLQLDCMNQAQDSDLNSLKLRKEYVEVMQSTTHTRRSLLQILKSRLIV